MSQETVRIGCVDAGSNALRIVVADTGESKIRVPGVGVKDGVLLDLLDGYS